MAGKPFPQASDEGLSSCTVRCGAAVVSTDVLAAGVQRTLKMNLGKGFSRNQRTRVLPSGDYSYGRTGV